MFAEFTFVVCCFCVKFNDWSNMQPKELLTQKTLSTLLHYNYPTPPKSSVTIYTNNNNTAGVAKLQTCVLHPFLPVGVGDGRIVLEQVGGLFELVFVLVLLISLHCCWLHVVPVVISIGADKSDSSTFECPIFISTPQVMR